MYLRYCQPDSYIRYRLTSISQQDYYYDSLHSNWTELIGKDTNRYARSYLHSTKIILAIFGKKWQNIFTLDLWFSSKTLNKDQFKVHDHITWQHVLAIVYLKQSVSFFFFSYKEKKNFDQFILLHYVHSHVMWKSMYDYYAHGIYLYFVCAI